MKKILSGILCVALVLSMSCIFTFADAPTKSETFIEDVNESNSLSIELEGDVPINITESLSFKISDVKACLKDDDIAVSATVFGFLKVKILVDDEDIYACITNMFCKINISELFENQIIDLRIVDEIDELAEDITEYFGYMKYEATQTNVDGYDIETFKPDLKKVVMAMYGDLMSNANIENLSDAEIMLLLGSLLDADAIQKIRKLMESEIKFYYATGTSDLKNIVAAVPNEEGTELKTINVSEILGENLGACIGKIGTNVDDAELALPFAFDLTGIVKYVIGMFSK